LFLQGRNLFRLKGQGLYHRDSANPTCGGRSLSFKGKTKALPFSDRCEKRMRAGLLVCFVFVIFVFVIMKPAMSWSRVFDFKKQGFATYLEGGGVLTGYGKDSYEKGFPTTTTSSGGFSQTYQIGVGLSLS